MAAALIVATVVAVMWLIAFTSTWLRHWRATLVLAVGSVAIAAATAVPRPFGAVLAAAVWAGVMYLILFQGEALSSVRGAERSFIDAYVASLRRIQDLSRDETIEPAAHVAEFEAVVDELEGLDPPSPEWAGLKRDAVRELRRRLVMMKLATAPSAATLAVAHAAWSDVERRFERLVRRKTDFWAGFPQIRR